MDVRGQQLILRAGDEDLVINSSSIKEEQLTWDYVQASSIEARSSALKPPNKPVNQGIKEQHPGLGDKTIVERRS